MTAKAMLPALFTKRTVDGILALALVDTIAVGWVFSGFASAPEHIGGLAELCRFALAWDANT